jgi:hypothetical protein
MLHEKERLIEHIQDERLVELWREFTVSAGKEEMDKIEVCFSVLMEATPANLKEYVETYDEQATAIFEKLSRFMYMSAYEDVKKIVKELFFDVYRVKGEELRGL